MMPSVKEIFDEIEKKFKESLELEGTWMSRQTLRIFREAKFQALMTLLEKAVDDKISPDFKPESVRDINFPQNTMQVIARTLDEGSLKYAPAAWRKLPIHEHLLRARQHIDLWIKGDVSGEDHIAHALTRLAFAADLESGADYGK